MANTGRLTPQYDSILNAEREFWSHKNAQCLTTRFQLPNTAAELPNTAKRTKEKTTVTKTIILKSRKNWRHERIPNRSSQFYLHMFEPNLNLREKAKSYFDGSHWRGLTEILERMSGAYLALSFRPKKKQKSWLQGQAPFPFRHHERIGLSTFLKKIPSPKYQRGPIIRLQAKQSELLFLALIKTIHNFMTHYST